MSSAKKKKLAENDLEVEDFENLDEVEGWESLAEEAEGGKLATNPELEAALQEAAEAVEEPGEKPPVGLGAGEGMAEEAERLREEARGVADEDHGAVDHGVAAVHGDELAAADGQAGLIRFPWRRSH